MAVQDAGGEAGGGAGSSAGSDAGGDAGGDANSPADEQPPPAGARRRRPRRDAEENRERLLTAATNAMLREGPNVPLATIASDAGVGIATLYRSFADRDALMSALQFRAYGLLNGILDDVDAEQLPGLDAVGQFLTRALAISGQLVLPLHGAPPIVTPAAEQARLSINQRLDRFIERGRAEYSIRAPLNTTDIIIFCALITQPLPQGPIWPRLAARQITNFLNGLATTGPLTPAPPLTRTDIERAFTPSSDR